jgi:hypothetical protein
MIRISRFVGTLFARCDDNGMQTRARAMQRIASEPELGAMVMATYAGPDTVPAVVFTDNFYARLFAP